MSLPRLPRFAFLVALGALIVALSLSCSTGSPQSTFDALGEVSRKQLTLFYIIFWAAAFVFVAVEGLLIYSVIKFRRKRGQGDPEQVHGNQKLEIAWTIAPAIVLAVIAVPTIITLFDLASPPDEDTLNVTVVGHQWFWEFEYPDLNITTANELHIPTGKVVNFNLESADVIHSFWVPKLGGKQDVIPNRNNSLWLKADEPGVYFGQCAEFCGVAHAQMRFRVIAHTPAEFDKWAEDFLRPAVPSSGLAREGEQLFTEKGCIACHTIKDNPLARGTIGPDITHFGLRGTVAAGILENDQFGESLTRWLTDPEAVKPGNTMATDAPVYTDPEMAMTNRDVAALVLYLKGLTPDETKDPIVGDPTPGPTPGPVPQPGPGDPANGEALFASQGCQACHSVGSDTIVGPGLAGVGDRAATRVEDLSAGQYIYQSIIDTNAFVVEGFLSGVMPQIYGGTLSHQQINDLIAYLMTLN